MGSKALFQGTEAAPRTQRTLEFFPAEFELTNPRARRICNPRRKWSLPLAIGEFAWHVSGSDDVNAIAYYADRWRNFSDNGVTIAGSCYGRKIFHGSPSRWSRMLQLMRADPDTRRGVFVFADPDLSFDLGSKDVACTTSIQFMIRKGCLHAFVTMRSNDIIWGLPYDVSLFTMLQELMACELNVEIGSYFHYAASLHLYERHFELAKEILETPDGLCSPMEPMTAINEIPLFLRCEEALAAPAIDRAIDGDEQVRAC